MQYPRVSVNGVSVRVDNEGRSPAVNEKIETVRPYGIFKLTSNDQGSFQYRPGVFSSVTINLKEALY